MTSAKGFDNVRIGTQRLGQAPRTLPLFCFSSFQPRQQGRKNQRAADSFQKDLPGRRFFESTTQDSGEKEKNSLPLVIAGSTKASFRESKNHLMTGVPVHRQPRALIPPSPRFARRGRLGQIYKILLKLFTTPQAAEYPVFFIVRAGGKV